MPKSLLRNLQKRRTVPEFGIVLTPEEQLALDHALERVEGMKGKASLIETGDRVNFVCQLYIRFLHEEATAKAEGMTLKQLQKLSLERRKTLRILKMDLRRQPEPEDVLSALDIGTEHRETLLSLITRDIKRIQQTIRPHPSFEEKLDLIMRKERNAKQWAQYKAKRK
jgi:hypothetical protein